MMKNRGPKFRKNLFFISLLMVSFSIWMACGEKENQSAKADENNKWISIFNGENLNGWTPKISGQKLGKDTNNTFVVEDGLLKVSYAEYDTFSNEFGHIFYEKAYKKYRMRLEYRFVGDQVKGGAGWAYRNNGIMFHAQSAASMGVDQAFPVCLEFQFLGGDSSGEPRTTGCLCTPGMNVTVSDTLNDTHCIANHGPTIGGDVWVKAELYVDGGKEIHHIIEGDTVFSYSNPVIGGGHLPEDYPVAVGTKIEQGFIALQAESAPIEFRNIELMDLE